MIVADLLLLLYIIVWLLVEPETLLRILFEIVVFNLGSKIPAVRCGMTEYLKYLTVLIHDSIHLVADMTVYK